MTETEAHSLRAQAARLRPLLPLLAGVLALLALWLAWSGWRQMRDDARRGALEQNRDIAAEATASVLTNERKRLADRIASAEAQAALRAGDLEGAGRAIAAGWRGVERVQVFAPTLEADYANLKGGGYGTLATVESALSTDKPVSWLVKDASGAKLALAAPAKVDGRLAGVAYAVLPAARVTLGLDNVAVGDDTYLALRQGGYTLAQRGDTAIADAAERLAQPIGDTGLRMVAAVPQPAGKPFGLGAIPALVAAALSALFAYLAWRASRHRHVEIAQAVAAPTLSETLEQDPLPTRAAAVAEVRESTRGTQVMVDKGIFRAYDIRGVVGETLDTGVAELIGHAIGSLMADKGLAEIVVGRDGRLSGPDMVGGLIEGLRKAGRNVVDIGMAPTPVVYFGAYHLRTGCCVSVTGSHNPPDYNGFKIVVGGETLSGDAITDLYRRIAGDRLHVASSAGLLSERDISQDYVERIASDVQLERPLKVVVDAGNGVAGDIGPRVLEAIGADVTPLFCEIDGTFPNHHPDPSEPHNLDDLVRMVQRLDADLGIAFDGDGDRLGVVTRDGANIFPDRLLMLFAADVLERNPGAVIVYDVKCTGRLQAHILRHGGSPLMWKTGHSLIKAKMRETEAELAGEMSGHFFFAERWYGFDDGIYAAARLLEILANRPETPSEVLGALPAGVSTPEIKVDAPDGDPHAFVERFVAQARFEGARQSTIDGLRVDWPDGWGLVRASNTTPVLVMRFDADDAATLARIQSAFREQILAVDPGLALPF